MSKSYVAHYRVWTSRQGRSGFGLEAQREAVAQFLRTCGGNLIAEFTEVESGNRNDRPKLQAALMDCRRLKATLAIARNEALRASRSIRLAH